MFPKDLVIAVSDLTGELDRYLNEAELVFVGGSLITRGGHNVLEPAGLGKCTIVGPHMDNFSLETRELLKAGGIIQVTGNRDLGDQLARMIDDSHMRVQYGISAQQFIKQKASVLNSYMKCLQPMLQH